MGTIPSPFVPSGAPVGPASGDLKGGYPAPQVASATHMSGAATSTPLLDTFVTGDTMARYNVNADGTMAWGSGSGAGDTNLYRAAAGILQTDSKFQVGGLISSSDLVIPTSSAPGSTANALTLFTPDGVSLVGVDKNGNIIALGGTVSSTVTPITIANTTTETVVASYTVAANTAAIGSAFQGFTSGVLSTPATGSPQITANLRIGGVSGTLIASITLPATTSQTNVSFYFNYVVGVVSIGSSGTWTGSILDIDVLSGANANVSAAPSPVTRDTTISNALVCTLQWSAAVSGNTLTCNQSFIRQIK
jgi:hypothetical protein